ncbi:MAG: type II toxin-antitoxin system RelE/ParE family toxin [Magnetococcales bacterium]|nr:type II toxin-antitoxin system RelE/ParE family toxin [Magnetococcales bacterium]
MRVFKNKWFNRWALGEGITDANLRNAALEIVAGMVEADLGGYLFKKRLARVGKGKSGGYRTIVGYRKAHSDRLVFLYAFPKNAKGNISSNEEAALSLAAEKFLNATNQQVNALVADGVIWEVKGDE